MDNSVHITYPGLPPSNNNYIRHTRRGRHYVAPEAEKFKDDIAILARGRKVESEYYRIRIDLYLAGRHRLDCDNAPKCILDALQDCGVITNDSKIDSLHIRKHRGAKELKTEIAVEAL